MAAVIAIERSSAQLYAAHGFGIVADGPAMTPAEVNALIGGEPAYVAVREAGGETMVVGYAIAGNVGGAFFLKEMAVDPDHGGQGIGSALLARFLDEARQRGHRTAALSTFRDVPFNAPFYRKHGFLEVDPNEIGSTLRDQFMREVPAGVGVRDRVLMVRVI